MAEKCGRRPEAWPASDRATGRRAGPINRRNTMHHHRGLLLAIVVIVTVKVKIIRRG
jgi:hypothetical protein